MKQNNFLSAIKPDTANAITGHYEQTTGLLPVSGTDNVGGVVKFEVSDREKGRGYICIYPDPPVCVCVRALARNLTGTDVYFLTGLLVL